MKDLRTLAGSLKKRCGDSPSPIALVFVANGVLGDSRVLKTASSLRELGYQCVLCGQSSSDYQLDTCDELPLALLPHKLQSSDGADVWAAWAEEFGKEVAELTANLAVSLVYSHDMWGFPAGFHAVNRQRACGRSVYWVHDIHEDVFGYDDVMSPEKIAAAQNLEKKYIKCPDLLVTVNETLRDELAARHSYSRIIEVVYNCPKVEAVTSGPEQMSLRSTLSLAQNVPLGVYAGRATSWRGLDVLVPVLKATPELHIAVVANGSRDYLNTITDAARDAGVIDRLHLLPYVPHSCVPQFLSDASFGISLITSYRNAENSVPTKLTEYLHARLPVIASKIHLQAKLVQEVGFGVVVEDSRCPHQVTRGIQAILKNRDALSSVITQDKISYYTWHHQFASVARKIREKHFMDTSSCGHKFRVFQGPGPNAGQPSALAKSLRSLGYASTAVCVNHGNKFGYNPDYVWYASCLKSMAALSHWALDNFDILHYHARPIFWHMRESSLEIPSLADMIAARSAGKLVVFSFRGGEARIHSEFARLSPFAWTKDEDYADFLSDEQKRQYITAISEIAHIVTVTDPELASYVPNAIILPRSIDCDELKFVGPQNSEKPVVIHAPSRRNVKGTEYILDAVEKLKAEGLDFDFQLVEGLENTEARKLYASADIIIDQLRIGWYGVLAVEGMALGKTVISYIRDDLTSFFDGPAPLLNANPRTIVNVLRRAIKDSELRSRTGLAARRFCEAYHDQRQVAKLLHRLYSEALAKRNTTVPHAFLDLVLSSAEMHQASATNLAISVKELKRTNLAQEKKLAEAKEQVAQLREQLSTAKSGVPGPLPSKPPSTSVDIPRRNVAALATKPGNYRKKAIFARPYSKILPRLLRRYGLWKRDSLAKN